MSNSTIEERLKSVIGSLEYEQEIKYNPMTSMTLSYLYDILNDEVPNHILETKIGKTSKGKTTLKKAQQSIDKVSKD